YYIDDGLIDKVVDANGNILDYSYDGTERLTKITDSINRETTITYDQTCWFLPEGQSGSYEPCDIVSWKGANGAARTVEVTYRKLGDVMESGSTPQRYHDLFPSTTQSIPYGDKYGD